nr:unnamed protein product [Callosobruchus analis]
MAHKDKSEYSEEEEGSDVEETTVEPRLVKSNYQELRSTYTKQLTPEHELDYRARGEGDEEEEEEEEDEGTLEEEEEEAADDGDEEEELEDEDEDYDEDEGDELLKRLDSKYGKLTAESGSSRKGQQQQEKLQGERFQKIVGTDVPSRLVQQEPSSDNSSIDDKLPVNVTQHKDNLTLNDKKDVADEVQNQASDYGSNTISNISK